MTTALDQAERLKTQGNTLFAKNDFTGAYQKYTEAIKHDKKNAILYCNRAACAFGLNRYIDSCTDAATATELDPSYAKAWSRLAQAQSSLDRPDQALRSWKRAVSALPVENLTPAQKKQRESYTAELAVVQAKAADIEANPKKPKDAVTMSKPEQIPWNRAAALIPGLQATRQWNSSAWVIWKAYLVKEWQDAIENMKMGRLVRNPAGAPAGAQGYFGRLGVIVGLTNALISDDRVFHISDQNFLDLYNKQILFEMTQTRAWGDSGARKVMEQIPARLRIGGWDAVRPAISITVRAWMMRGFMEEKLKNNVETALEFYTSALEVLQWGKELWKDVSFDDKGAVFRETFIRGVKCMRLDAFIAAYYKHPGEDSKFPLKEILAGGDDLLAELGSAPQEPAQSNAEDIAFCLSFFRYPRGQAHATRGFYYHHMGIIKRKKEGLSEELMVDHMKASQEYLAAASHYPIDDEKHAWYLHVAFNVQFEVGGPVSYLLMILNKLHDAIPRMKPIWEFSADARSGVHDALEADMKSRGELLRMAEGKTEDELSGMVIRRDWVQEG
ncbi:hypothetical protein LXA43DRAFT_1056655 [Ganoderma leucocontextum]|nr:hypothetical protein LXA43DRAFT_1056655 [Ganoderma leucocontextum]